MRNTKEHLIGTHLGILPLERGCSVKEIVRKGNSARRKTEEATKDEGCHEGCVMKDTKER